MYLSRDKIEELAGIMVEEYMDYPKVKLQKEISRIDPFILAENIVKLNIDYRTLSDDGTVFGCTAYTETTAVEYTDSGEQNEFLVDGNTIVIEKALLSSPITGKLNFTVMHETCHQILRRLYPKEYGPQDTGFNKVIAYKVQPAGAKTDWDEWQANALASAILMPEELVLKQMKSVGLGTKTRESMITQSIQPVFRKFCEIADGLGVSLQALRIRMKQLGYLVPDEKYCGYKVIDISKEI